MLEIFYADILFYNLIYYQKLHGSNDFPQPDGFSGGPSAYKTSANTPKLTHLFNELVQRLKQEIFVASNFLLNVFVVSTYIFCI